MFEYFRGWKRKAGLMTLLLACAFAAGWVRSITVGDEIQLIAWFGRPQRIISHSGLFAWTDWDHLPPWWPRYETWHEPRMVDDVEVETVTFDVNGWPIQLSDPVLDMGRGPEASHRGLRLIFRYWSIVAPLALLSAYLFLSKPRSKRKQTEPTNP